MNILNYIQTTHGKSFRINKTDEHFEPQEKKEKQHWNC